MIGIAWLQQILNKISVPAQDSTDNVVAADVIGNKTDALVEAVGTTKSLAGYLKGLIQELDQKSVPMCGYLVTAGSALADVVNINDKGMLTGFVGKGSSGTDYIYIKVTLDGVCILDADASGIGQVTETDAVSIPFHHRFNTSLRVQARNAAGTATMVYLAPYTKDA